MLKFKKLRFSMTLAVIYLLFVLSFIIPGCSSGSSGNGDVVESPTPTPTASVSPTPTPTGTYEYNGEWTARKIQENPDLSQYAGTYIGTFSDTGVLTVVVGSDGVVVMYDYDSNSGNRGFGIGTVNYDGYVSITSVIPSDPSASSTGNIVGDTASGTWTYEGESGTWTVTKQPADPSVSQFAGSYAFDYTGASDGVGHGVIGSDGTVLSITTLPLKGGSYPVKIDSDGYFIAATETETTTGNIWGTISGNSGSGNWGTNSK